MGAMKRIWEDQEQEKAETAWDRVMEEAFKTVGESEAAMKRGNAAIANLDAKLVKVTDNGRGWPVRPSGIGRDWKVKKTFNVEAGTHVPVLTEEALNKAFSKAFPKKYECEADKPIGTRDVDKFLREQQDKLWRSIV